MKEARDELVRIDARDLLFRGAGPDGADRHHTLKQLSHEYVSFALFTVGGPSVRAPRLKSPSGLGPDCRPSGRRANRQAPFVAEGSNRGLDERVTCVTLRAAFRVDSSVG